MMLGDLGAEVIKIENPTDGGDVSRVVGPYFFPDGDSQFFQAFNRNKRSVTLDLRTDAGRAIFHDLVRKSDVVFDNFRPGVLARLGIDHTRLTYRYQGRDFRLTDIHGHVMHDLIA